MPFNFSYLPLPSSHHPFSRPNSTCLLSCFLYGRYFISLDILLALLQTSESEQNRASIMYPHQRTYLAAQLNFLFWSGCFSLFLIISKHLICSVLVWFCLYWAMGWHDYRAILTSTSLSYGKSNFRAYHFACKFKGVSPSQTLLHI